LPKIEDVIRNLAQKGYQRFDLDLYDPVRKSKFMEADWQERLEPIRQAMEELNVCASQAHAESGNPLTEPLEDVVAVAERALECCAYLNIPWVVVHPGGCEGVGQQEFYQKNAEFYKRLIPTIERTGVDVLIENIGAENDPYYIRTGEELLYLIEMVGHPKVNACWDTGHANHNMWDQTSSIKALGSRLKAIHVQDNVGGLALTKECWRADLHLPPFFGCTNYDMILNALLDINYQGTFSFEVEAPKIHPRRPDCGDPEAAAPGVLRQGQSADL